jgi:hypothetical protein
MPDEQRARNWRRLFRVSVRAMMILVVVLGGGLGWVAHLVRQARIQREAVAAIRKIGGSYLYDWQLEGRRVRVKKGTNIISHEVPGWPKWLLDRLGVDAFGSVTDVSLRRPYGKLSIEEIDEAFAQVGRLPGLKRVTFLQAPATDARLAHLKGLSHLESLMLRGRNEVSDAGVAHLARMTSVKGLYLEDSRITASGLAYAHELTGLETLNLARTQIGDQGLAHLEGLTRLENLGLDGTAVSDAGLVRLLRRCKRLKGLYLNDTRITDAGLQPLEKMVDLGWLFLRNTRISDAGLVHLEGLTKLQSLDLYNTRISDAGLPFLKGLVILQHLNLDGTQVSDASLAHLNGLTGLKELRLFDTGVTAAGLAELREALPNLTIQHPGAPGSGPRRPSGPSRPAGPRAP